LWGHYNRDIEHYRPNSDRRDASARDPISCFSSKLIADGVLTAEQFKKLGSEVSTQLQQVLHEVVNAAEPDPGTASDHVYAPRFAGESVQRAVAGESEKPQTMTYIRAVNQALRRELETRPNVLVYGEDVGKAGGIFGAARQLQKEFGQHRVFDTPISESAILGSAVGAAMAGMKPIIEIMWADFMLVALDQLVNQAANIRYVTGGEVGAPFVVRTQQGVTPGSCAQHSQSLEALLLHIPGLRVALPATPQDAYSILRAAVAAADPCIVIEARALYQTSGLVSLSDRVEPIGFSRLRRAGSDAAILTWGTMVHTSLQAAEKLQEEGLCVGVLDLRWLSPLDEDAIMDVAIAASGRVVIVHEANLTAGFGAEIASRLHERLGRDLSLQVSRVASPDTRMPAAPMLQRRLLPDVSRIAGAVRALMKQAERGVPMSPERT
jgi:2-oxoisovalerate dehydrogenase E1 component